MSSESEGQIQAENARLRERAAELERVASERMQAEYALGRDRETSRRVIEAELRTSCQSAVGCRRAGPVRPGRGRHSEYQGACRPACLQTLGVEFCQLRELSADGTSLVLTAGIGWKPGAIGHSMSTSSLDSQSGYALLSNEPVIVRNYRELVEKAEGTLYWLDLARMLEAEPRALDCDRVGTLARFLATTHAYRRDEPTLYERRLRELVGYGECVMGILDSYPAGYPLLPESAREALERGMVSWRWRLRPLTHRLRRVHGDFHPWNLLFRQGSTEFAVLDRSRGEWGEPADDVAALGINYLFFGLQRGAHTGRRGIDKRFLDLFETFLDAYIATSRDAEVLDVLPPFLAFRALVIAHPRWYPHLDGTSRASLLRFADRMVTGSRLVVADVVGVFR